MSHATAMATLILMMLTLGIMGAWDGIVRRHIRFSLDVYEINVIFGGVRAVLVGMVCALIAALALKLGVQGIEHISIACHNEPTCILQHTVLPLLLDWRSALVVLTVCVLFFPWLSGALNMQGPFRQRLLAWGVWYREQDLVPLVTKRLQEAELPQIPLDTLIGIARIVWQNARVLAPENVSRRKEVPSRFQGTLARQAAKRYRVSESAAQVVVATIAEYYLKKHEQAVSVWPWRRRILGY